MRVIAGRFGGRRLRAGSGRGVRPTTDRVREALFNVLGEAVVDARVLDLWAGTGALSIEALSRGARRATCVDRSPRALKGLSANVAALGLEGEVEVVRADALAYAGALDPEEEEEYDVVFCDPPYADPLEPVLERVITAPWWTTVCVLEHAARRPAPRAPGLEPDERRYGDTALALYWRP